jgi:hypothetical protein
MQQLPQPGPIEMAKAQACERAASSLEVLATNGRADGEECDREWRRYCGEFPGRGQKRTTV